MCDLSHFMPRPIINTLAGVAELVDALDSKSSVPRTCGFESHLRHHYKNSKTQLKSPSPHLKLELLS